MGIIYKIADTSFHKTKGEIYRIDITNKTPEFWMSFPWENIDIIKPKQNKDNITVTFRASSVQTLHEFLAHKEKRITYNEALQFFLNMKAQLEALEKQNITIATFDLEDIIVINDIQFFYINQDKIAHKINPDQFELLHPIPKNTFSPPELKKAGLPAILPFQTSFYSMAAVITFCLTNDPQHNYEKALESIAQTPLYWALMRCLEKNPQDRFLLMI